MDTYDGRNPVRYFGSVSSAIGFMLFALGAAGVLVSAIALTMGFSWQAEDKWLLAIPAWSLIAIPLSLATRSPRLNSVLYIFAGSWLALAVGAMLIFEILG
jgi:hypothetical protein